MNEVLRFAVPLVEPGENSEDLGRALGAEDGVGLGEGGHVEGRVGFAPQLGVEAEQAQLEVGRHAHAGVLQQRGDVVGRVAQHRILEVDDADALGPLALRQPNEVGRMVVSQRQHGRRGEHVGEDLAPEVGEAGLGAGGDHRLGDVRRIPFRKQLDLDQQRLGVVGRHGVGATVAVWQGVGRGLAMQAGQHRHRLGVALGDDAVVVDEQLGAEVLDDGEAGLRLMGVDLRRGEPHRAQRAVDGDVGPDILGEMGDGAVGLAVTDRRSVRPRRRDHQDRLGAVGLDQALVGARRGVAHHEGALGPDEVGLLQDCAHRARQRETPAEGADSGHCAKAVARRLGGVGVEGDVEPVAGEAAAGALRPFHDDQRAIGRLVPAEFGEFGGILDAKQVGVNDRELGAVLDHAVVDLKQREGRARHLERLVAGQRADEGAGEGGLAAAELAREGDEVAGLQQRGDVGGERHGRALVR